MNELSSLEPGVEGLSRWVRDLSVGMERNERTMMVSVVVVTGHACSTKKYVAA